ncbi:MAG: hypothetical protein M0000_00555 [Actinomycetota bacterium]|nr:hypothetical protein [Actinomycetota bacterium]
MNLEARNPARKCGYVLAGADGRALSVSAHDGAVAGDTRVEPGARLCVDYAHGKWLFAAIDPPTAGSLASLRVSRSEDWPPRLFKVELPAAHRRLRAYPQTFASPFLDVVEEFPACRVFGRYGRQVITFVGAMVVLNPEGWSRLAHLNLAREARMGDYQLEIQKARTELALCTEGAGCNRRRVAVATEELVRHYAWTEAARQAIPEDINATPQGVTRARVSNWITLAARALAVQDLLTEATLEELLTPFITVMGPVWERKKLVDAGAQPGPRTGNPPAFRPAPSIPLSAWIPATEPLEFDPF